jgi:hypothetical protein
MNTRPFTVPDSCRRDAARLPGQALLLKKPVQRRGFPLRPRNALRSRFVQAAVRLALERLDFVPDGLFLDARHKLQLASMSRLPHGSHRIASSPLARLLRRPPGKTARHRATVLLHGPSVGAWRKGPFRGFPRWCTSRGGSPPTCSPRGLTLRPGVGGPPGRDADILAMRSGSAGPFGRAPQLTVATGLLCSTGSGRQENDDDDGVIHYRNSAAIVGSPLKSRKSPEFNES